MHISLENFMRESIFWVTMEEIIQITYLEKELIIGGKNKTAW